MTEAKDWAVESGPDHATFRRGPLAVGLYRKHEGPAGLGGHHQTSQVIVDATIDNMTLCTEIHYGKGASGLLRCDAIYDDVLENWPRWWEEHMRRYGEAVAVAEALHMEKTL